MESADEPQYLESSLLLFCNFLLVLIFFGGIASNFLVLLVFYRKPGLRTTANRFVINLIIINVLSCISLLPITFVDNTTDAPDSYLYFAERFSSVFCSSLIVYSVLLIAIDQYFAVVDPLHYHCIISSWKGYLMIVSTWVFSAGLAFLGAVQQNFGFFRNTIFRECDVSLDKSTDAVTDINSVSEDAFEILPSPVAPGVYRIIFSVAYATTAFLIPFALICFIYYKICVAASGNSRRARTSILTNDESCQIVREKYQSKSDVEKPTDECSGSALEEKNNKKLEKMSDAQPESLRLLGSENHESSLKPSFVLTRPSPPRPFEVEAGDSADCDCSESDNKKEENDSSTVPKVEESSVKIKVESEVPFLKPTLKNNASFSKLSSLHIQFSNSTDKITDGNPTERRHSNVPLTTVDPEFQNISKNRSSSMQSNIYEMPSRPLPPAKSNTTSTHTKSSRSSSINSTSTKHPPSRASSIRSTSSYIVHNIRHRISNASLFRYREEARAARISAMVIVMALLCWLPFFVAVSLHTRLCFEEISILPQYFDAFSVILLLLSTIITPFLFALRNRQIKREIRKIFQFCPEDLKWSPTKSFYKHNFSISLKSQTVHLFTELSKKATGKQVSHVGSFS